MTKINRKIEYALMALKFMLAKRPGELSSAKEICEQTGAAFDATAKVMQVLAHHGILKSEQGVNGGYQIIKDLAKVSFYDLSELLLGPVAVVKCVKTEEPCDLFEKCNIKSPIMNINNKLIEFYKNLNLKEVLNSEVKKTDSFNNQALGHRVESRI